jgi:hypothetical protein
VDVFSDSRGYGKGEMARCRRQDDSEGEWKASLSSGTLLGSDFDGVSEFTPTSLVRRKDCCRTSGREIQHLLGESLAGFGGSTS